MTPEQFKLEMEMAYSPDGDIEIIHGQMDELLCKVLKDLGYTEGIEIFEKQPKWYA